MIRIAVAAEFPAITGRTVHGTVTARRAHHTVGTAECRRGFSGLGGVGLRGLGTDFLGKQNSFHNDSP